MNKSLRWISIPILVAAALLVGGAAQETDPAGAESTPGRTTAEYQAAERAIHNVFGWAVEKDFELFFATLADDSAFVAVTPYDRVKFGIEAVRKDTAFWANPDFKGIGHEIRDLRIRFSRSGEVAWFYCELDDFNEWKGEPANWENVRWTGVLEKRADRWRLVQHHMSFAKS